MKLIQKLNQFRRDLDAKVQCENCGNIEIIRGAYDDRNYWDNVLPNRRCKNCGKSAKEQGIEHEPVGTKYADYEVV